MVARGGVAGLPAWSESYRRRGEEILKKDWKKKAQNRMWKGVWVMDEIERSGLSKEWQVKETGEAWND